MGHIYHMGHWSSCTPSKRSDLHNGQYIIPSHIYISPHYMGHIYHMGPWSSHTPIGSSDLYPTKTIKLIAQTIVSTTII